MVGTKPGIPPNQTESGPAPTKPQPPASAASSSVVSRGSGSRKRILYTSLGLLQEKKFAEAEKTAGEVLGRSPQPPGRRENQARGAKNLDAVDEGLKRARMLLGRKKYAEVASALGGVLAVDADNPEALRLMSQVDNYARKNAEDARKQMEQTKQQAGQAGALSLVQNQYQVASVIETEAARLFQSKKFGEATGKFYEASDAYKVAEGGARSKAAEMARESASREKPAGSGEVPPAPAPVVVDRQKEERERQVVQQRNQAQSAWNEYLNALSRASQVGADRLASDIYHQATSLGTRAQEEFNQGNYAGAQADFGEALRQLVNAIGRAEEIGQQRRHEDEGQQKEIAQRAEDVRAIQQAVRLYQGAMENKDIVALKNLWPGMSRESEMGRRKLFKDLKSIRVELEPVGEARLSEGFTVAVVTYRQVQRLIFMGGTRRIPSLIRRSSSEKPAVGGLLIQSRKAFGG